MLIIGCDLHTRFQQIAMLDTETGEVIELRLEHDGDQARQFYAALPSRAIVGIEATGYARWFESMLAELGHELWVGNAAQIRAARVRKQKTDARDAQHLLQLLVEKRFPRIWMASARERDVWQLLRHRDKLVRFRTSVRNQLHALALGEGLCRKKKLWSQTGRRELESLSLGDWATRRRQDLLQMLDRLDSSIVELDAAVRCQVESRAAAAYLMSRPGVGPVTSLAFVLAVGPVSRFCNSRKLVSYLGLNPSEDSSGGKQRLGAISKQGNTLLRFLLLEAAQTASQYDEELRRDYRRLMSRRGKPVAKVAIARKLAVRLYWMLRHFEAQTPAADSHAGKPVVATGPDR